MGHCQAILNFYLFRRLNSDDLNHSSKRAAASTLFSLLAISIFTGPAGKWEASSRKPCAKVASLSLSDISCLNRRRRFIITSLLTREV
jgi:hypothetical protein